MHTRRLLLCFGLMVLMSSGASAQQGPVIAATEDTSHCRCVQQTGERYDPYDAFDDPHMPTAGVEVELRRWAYVERIYAACMRDNGFAPREDAFPYGVSDYPGGPEFRPVECRS